MNIRHQGQLKKLKFKGAVLELPAKQHCQSSPFTKKLAELSRMQNFVLLSKAELLQLNQTQFPSLGFFVSKKVGNLKNYDHFYYMYQF